MATGIRITCPGCQQQMMVPESVRGKKVRCKGCNGVVPVPAGGGPDTRMTTPEAQAKKAARAAADEAENERKPYGVTEINIAPRCPHCAYEMDPPDARICLHCGYDMIRRTRAESVKTYDRTFFDWAKWLGPGIGCLIGLGVIVGLCIYYHYYLPEQMFNTWGRSAEAAKGDRFDTVSKTMEESWLALMFHPGIETWVFVIGIWLSWKCLSFAFRRLVLNYMPPERIREK
jgi:ribosomal protein S27E